MHRLIALLILPLALLTASAQVGAPTTPLQKDLLALVKTVEAGKTVPPRDITAFTTKHDDLDEIMGAVYRPRAKKGLGVGKAGVGIEKTLNDLDKVKGALPLVMRKDELLKIAAINVVLADVTRNLPTTKAKKPANIKAWTDYIDALKKTSQDLATAVKANNQANAKKALGKIVAACTGCHSDFK